MAMCQSAMRVYAKAGTGMPCAARVKHLAVCIRALMLGSLVVAPIAHAELPVVLPGGRWDGALPPSFENAGQDLLIEQISKQATLEWQSFNIGMNNGVRFDQPGADSIALNRIYANDPSVINGRLTANGQVYLINQNGIVFDKNAQIDVNTLIASTLNIEDEIFEQGILGAIQEGEAAFVADATMPMDALIEIRQGARLSASQGDGGRILILAPNILNSGDIETPDGQAILAAAQDKVYLTSSSDTDLRGLLVEVQTGGDVTNVGSIIAERGNVSILGMSVNQNGLVRATSTVSLNGSILLVAGENPSGVPAFSGVGGFTTQQGGTLVLGEGSVTEVVPEGEDKATDSQVQPVSYVGLAGKTVTVESGARVTVTGGEVYAFAGESLISSAYNPADAAEEGVSINIESGAVIDVSGDDTTVVPVSSNVIAVEARGNELADSFLQRDGAIRNQTLYIDIREGTPFLNIEGAEALIERGVNERFSAGGTITLQSRGDVVVEDGAILDISGGQVTYTGDNVITSKLVTADGQVFDISEADPTRHYVGVLGGDLVIDHAKWGVSEFFSGALGSFQSGYVQGKDAGSLLIQTRRLSFNGQLLAGSVVGDLQRYAPDTEDLEFAYLRPHDQRAQGGSLTVELQPNVGTPQIVLATDDARLSDPQRGLPLAADRPTVLSVDMLESSGVSTLDIKTTGSISIDAPLTLPEHGALHLAAGKITINDDIHSAGGVVDIAVDRATGSNILGGFKLIADEEVGLQVATGVAIDVGGLWSNESPRLNATPATAPIVIDGGTITLSSGGDLVLEHGSVLDVSAGAHLAADGTLSTGQGGAISLNATDNEALLATYFSVEAELRGYAFENGGSLALTANDFLIAGQAQVDALLLETLADGSARYTLEGSGALRSLLDHANNGEQRVLVDADFFRSGGFDTFELTATRGGLEIADNTQIVLRAQNHVLDTQALIGFFTVDLSSLQSASREAGNGNPLEFVPTSTALDDFTQLAELPDYLRAPVDLSLASAYGFGDVEDANADNFPLLSLGSGAAILGDPGAQIALASDTSLWIHGRIDAPAGGIELTLDSSYRFYAAEQMIWLGPTAELSAAGSVLMTPHELGLRRGDVLDAGSIVLQANFGSIVTAAGSRMDVDAVAATLDLPTGSGAIAPVVIAGQAGVIQLTAAESILLQGELSGHAALPNQAGGTLAVTLDPTQRPDEGQELIGDGGLAVPFDERYPSGPRIINLTAYTGDLPEPGTAIAAELNGQAFVSAEQVVSGGFDALDLKVLAAGSGSQPDRPESGAIINFPEDLSLALDTRISLDAPVLSTTDALVQLSASYAAIGSTDTRFRLDGSTPHDGGGTLQIDPSGGDGQLRITANLIDLIGDTVTQGFGDTSGSAVQLVSVGDIRLLGTRLIGATDWEGSFRVAGDLSLQAQQIYPVTLSDFEIAVESTGGTLEVLGQNGQPGQPLSVGGRVTLNADNIIVRDGAVVRAPIGAIVLTGTATDANGAAVGAHSITLEGGSLLSTSAAGLSIPFGVTQFEETLVMNIGGNVVPFVTDPEGDEKALPEKNIQLIADAIDVQSGAQFDLSGGGDIRATEFIPGPGGSLDILLADLDTGSGVEVNPSFAILPLLGSQFAPIDPIASPAAMSVQGLQIGQTLVLEEGIDGLPAGEYAVLPALYALFGGYLVTPVAASQDMLAGQNQSYLQGVPILAGHLDAAGVDISGSRTQGFAIEDGTRVRLRAEYAENSLDSLFAGGSARTPTDAGILTIVAGRALTLAGNLVPTLTGGRGSAVDIVANEISILSQRNGGEGVELLASDLEGLNADSLLIGATRTLTDAGLAIDPVAKLIEVEAGVNLAVRELLLVADQVHIGTGSTQATQLTATGTDTQAADPLIVAGNAAVVMVSSKPGATLTRSADGSVAELSVAAGVTLTASGSIVLDANGDVDLAGTLNAEGATLALGGASVSLGETDGRGLSGLVLSNSDLARLNGTDLTLRSAAAVDIYGALEDSLGNALVFERLAIDAQGIVGQDNAGATAHLMADDLELRNLSGAELSAVATGSGQLVLQAERLLLDSGSFTLLGYEQTTLRAAEYLLASGVGDLTVAGALTLDTPLLTAAGGAERNISAEAALSVIGSGAQAALPELAGLGADLNLSGESIDFVGNAVLPSGHLSLEAVGDIVLNSGAVIDVAGRDVLFAFTPVGTPGGLIRIESSTADIILNAGVTLDVSGAPSGGGAGRVELIAPLGTLAVSSGAELRASDSGEQSGEMVVDAGLLASIGSGVDNALTIFNQVLGDTDFLGRRELRVREGDLQVETGEVMRAHEITLTADSGAIVIDGTLDASGSDGGSIVLAAGDELDVNGTLDAHATASDGDGGRVELAALDADGDDLDDGIRGDVVNLAAGSVIDVRGGADGAGGSVLVRALAYDADSNGVKEAVAVGALDAELRGVARADVEAVHAFTDTSITSSDMTTWLNALNQFMASNTADLPASWRLLPGLQITSTGDLTLASEWDLYANAEDADAANDWRFGADNDVPGILTLLAAGDVKINQSLTDGFVDDQFAIAQFFFVGDEGTPYERLATAESWRYRIVAGADTTSANVLATTQGTDGDILLAADKQLRTGTGDIELAASGDIQVGANAAIYTAGLNSGAGALSDLLINISTFGNFDFNTFEIVPVTGEAFLLAYLNLGQFPIEGGDIRIQTGGDLIGAAADVNFTDWQPRIGGDMPVAISGSNSVENLPIHWAIAFDEFKDGIGALGGGDISARIGGDLRNLAIALPTTGKPEQAEVLVNDATTLIFAAGQSAPLVNGGGDLALDIAGDLLGGALQIDRGTATLRIGGDLGDASDTQQPYFALADSQLHIETGGDLNLGGIVNTTALLQQGNMATAAAISSVLAGSSNAIWDAVFFSYSESAAVNLNALAGEVVFEDQSSVVGNGFGLYAPTLRVRSFQGGIGFAGDVQTYPSALGQLELLAEGDIRSLSPTSLNYVIQSDADAALLPASVNALILSGSSTLDDLSRDALGAIKNDYLTPPAFTADGAARPVGRSFHATTPVHANDVLANLIISRSGSITGKADPRSLWEFILAKQTWVSAAENIRDMSFKIQHVQDTDLSVVSAGGHIIQSLPRGTAGGFSDTDHIIEIAGPGRIDVLAGEDIDLGGSQGIVSVGDTFNSVLADKGADIVVMAGLAEAPDYAAFIQTYLEDSALYLNDLNTFLAARGVIANGDPVGTFRDLSPLQQRELILDIFFQELKASGVAATSTGDLDYSRGFAAIAALFPEAQTTGDISTPVSVIKTVDGGDIDMLAPYGEINAGATFRAIEKASDELGIITASGGDINIFLDGDLQVNRERVFALQGDLVVWSSNGDIDAGKGAKTVVSIPDPIVSVDAFGNTVVTFPPAVDGSGLSAVNAFLFAPSGVINAGDAGINISGNLTLGATEVLGADNIDVGGVSVGVPVAPPPPPAVDPGASSSADSLAEESTSSLGGDGEEQGGPTLGLLSVEVLSIGDEGNCDQSDPTCK